MIQHVRPAVMMTVLFTVLLGLIYPLAMTGVSGLAFPYQAGGSLLKDGSGQVVGSALIAQGFAKPQYLHPRPSAAGNGYDASSSGGTNLGPLDKKLIDRVAGDVATLHKDDGPADIPADAVTTSGSGLDPEVSPANAHLQAARIAQARGRTVSEVLAVIDANTKGPTFGFLGQTRVNVLDVNRALDARYAVGQPKAP